MATINNREIKCPMCQCEKFEHVKRNYPLFIDTVSNLFEAQPAGSMPVDVYVCQECKYVMVFA